MKVFKDMFCQFLSVKKRYCEECKYYGNTAHILNTADTVEFCDAPENMKEPKNYRIRKWRLRKPAKINKYNDCQYYASKNLSCFFTCVIMVLLVCGGGTLLAFIMMQGK